MPTITDSKSQLIHNSMRLRPIRIRAPVILSLLLLVIILGVQLPLYILDGTHNLSTLNTNWLLGIAITWTVIFSMIIALQAIAFIRATHLKSTLNTEPRSDIFKMLTRIQVASLILVVINVGDLLTKGIFGLSTPGGFYRDPHCNSQVSLNVVRAGRLFMALDGMTCLWFIWKPLTTAIRHRVAGGLTTLQTKLANV